MILSTIHTQKLDILRQVITDIEQISNKGKTYTLKLCNYGINTCFSKAYAHWLNYYMFFNKYLI